MYYSVIGMIAIVLHLIMNHEYIKIDKNQDEIKKAFRKFVFASLMYFITDVLWGIINSFKLATLLYVDTFVYYISMALTIAYLCNYVTEYLHLRSGFGKFIRMANCYNIIINGHFGNDYDDWSKVIGYCFLEVPEE